MTPFTYTRPDTIEAAIAILARDARATPLGGGTCLLDLMKQGVETPATIVDLNFVPSLTGVSITASGALRVGAATPLSHVARDRRVAAGWPLLHEAIVDGLTPQLRNAVSVAGNVMQRPRCIYFREPGFDCNKRAPGSGCAAQAGVHYQHALFGGVATAVSCIAVHPSNMCVALTALDAQVFLQGQDGARTLGIAELHRLPGSDPSRETTLRAGELITAIEVPSQGGRGGAYVKGSEGFTLASCAALLVMNNGRIAAARIVLGGVAHKPWRSFPAEAALTGRPPTSEAVSVAIDACLAEAAPDAQTGFRMTLLRGVITEALATALARNRDAT